VTFSSDNHDLLDDVLREAEPSGYREALLNLTLRRVRQRRRLRRGRLLIGAFAMIGVLVLILSRIDSDRVRVLRTSGRNCEMVTTRPLSPAAIVSTEIFDRARWVVTTSSVPTVHTNLDGNNIRLLSDHELLVVAGATHPAVLIRLGPHTQELIFARREDREIFLRP